MTATAATGPDYEAEYNNRQRVPEHADIGARWAKASAAYRASAAVERDLSYGDGARNIYDLFNPPSGAETAPLVAFIHGGYWQRGHHHDSAHVAAELNGRGVAVALASYTLCPAGTVMDIVGEMRRFLAALWRRTGRRPVVVGHSAGGHLAAAMLATDWSAHEGVPADLVRAAYAISGVFDLPPLVATSLNAALGLDAKSAREASPLLWPAPPRERTMVAAVGGLESNEFLRQSLDIAHAWSMAGVKAECVVVPMTNHFTIIDELGRAESAMVARIAGLAAEVARG